MKDTIGRVTEVPIGGGGGGGGGDHFHTKRTVKGSFGTYYIGCSASKGLQYLLGYSAEKKMTGDNVLF